MNVIALFLLFYCGMVIILRLILIRTASDRIPTSCCSTSFQVHHVVSSHFTPAHRDHPPESTMSIISVALSFVLGGVFLIGLGKFIPPFSEPPRSVEVAGAPAKKGEGKPRRHAKFADKLLTSPTPGVNTLYDVAQVGLLADATRRGPGRGLRCFSHFPILIRVDSSRLRTPFYGILIHLIDIYSVRWVCLLSIIPFTSKQYAARTYKGRELLGARPVLNIVTEEKEVVKDGKAEVKKWTYFELGHYEWWSARDFLQIAKDIGSGLRNLGYGATDILWWVLGVMGGPCLTF